jgi:hypothetical protein
MCVVPGARAGGARNLSLDCRYNLSAIIRCASEWPRRLPAAILMSRSATMFCASHASCVACTESLNQSFHTFIRSDMAILAVYSPTTKVADQSGSCTAAHIAASYPASRGMRGFEPAVILRRYNPRKGSIALRFARSSSPKPISKLNSGRHPVRRPPPVSPREYWTFLCAAALVVVAGLLPRPSDGK